jgi:8-oxo-dGTP pyrophosphatase MutT (NUDIX family)
MELNTTILTTPPLDAATVVMLRDGPDGLQVLLMRRHQASNVLGGVYVFPGGKLDPEDQSPAWLPRLSQDSATLHQRLNEPDIPSERASGLFVAAMREAYEECRVLLGCAPHAEPQAQALLQALRSGQSWVRFGVQYQAVGMRVVFGFFGGKLARLLRSDRSPRKTMLRVSCGKITRSM